MTPDTLVRQLRWRYATKAFDPSRRVPADQWAALEQALVLSPSSFGLQPWKFVVITDPAVKETLVPVSWGQTQPKDCSHMVVFARREKLSDADVDRLIDATAEARGIPRGSLDAYRGMMTGFRGKAESEGWLNAWADRQVYIALGTLMTSAAVLGIDTCPMEGIDPAQYDRLLGLENSGYATVVACAVGYRSADDKYASLAKVRYPASEVVLRL